jgi:hypothetical protein
LRELRIVSRYRRKLTGMPHERAARLVQIVRNLECKTSAWREPGDKNGQRARQRRQELERAVRHDQIELPFHRKPAVRKLTERPLGAPFRDSNALREIEGLDFDLAKGRLGSTPRLSRAAHQS